MVHLDVNPANILVMHDLYTYDASAQFDDRKDGGGQANQSQRFLHLVNFCNSSGFYKQKFSNNLISSLYFMAPERVSGKMMGVSEYDEMKADIWSVGVILFILVFGRPPFNGALTSNLVKSIKKGQIKLKDSNWNDNLRLFVQLVI